MELEANTPRLRDIVSILDRIPANIVCDLPFPAFLSHFARYYTILYITIFR